LRRILSLDTLTASKQLNSRPPGSRQPAACLCSPSPCPLPTPPSQLRTAPGSNRQPEPGTVLRMHRCHFSPVRPAHSHPHPNPDLPRQAMPTRKYKAHSKGTSARHMALPSHRRRSSEPNRGPAMTEQSAAPKGRDTIRPTSQRHPHSRKALCEVGGPPYTESRESAKPKTAPLTQSTPLMPRSNEHSQAGLTTGWQPHQTGATDNKNPPKSPR
jgi:hypothetical protein